MINNLINLFDIAERYLIYLDGKFSFSENGLPIFEKEMFLKSEPKLIIPFHNRNNKIVTAQSKTVICFFSEDSDLYCRLEKVFDDIAEYKKYMGVIGLDITVTEDMDKEWQDFIMLINQLFLAILAYNGIKIIMNTRIGSPNTVNNLRYFPKNEICATSFLGCDKLKEQSNFSFISKILCIRPSKLLIYGKHDEIAESQLSNMGISYHNYVDFHRLTKGVA